MLYLLWSDKFLFLLSFFFFLIDFKNILYIYYFVFFLIYLQMIITNIVYRKILKFVSNLFGNSNRR